MREATFGDWEQRKGAEVPWELHFHALSKHIWRYFCGGFLDLPNELFCILRLDLSGKMYRFIKFIICILRLCLFGEMFHLIRFCLNQPQTLLSLLSVPTSPISWYHAAAPGPSVSLFCLKGGGWGGVGEGSLSLCHLPWMDDLAQRFRCLCHHILPQPGLSAHV